MGLKNLVEQKSEIELGGKKFLLRFPNRATRELQETYGGWVKAWAKMTFQERAEPMLNEIDYDILADILVIAIHQEGVDRSKVATWLADLMQDETIEIINALVACRNRYGPEPKDSTVEVISHLEAAKALLLADKREAEVSAFDELLDALKEEVADNEDDPPKQTA